MIIENYLGPTIIQTKLYISLVSKHVQNITSIIYQMVKPYLQFIINSFFIIASFILGCQNWL